MALADDMDTLARVVFEGDAKTPAALRRAAGERAGYLAKAAAKGAGLPAEWVEYVDKVARHAYRVTDEDVAALRRAGHVEDEIFEITVAAAVGAALARAEAGLKALKGDA